MAISLGIYPYIPNIFRQTHIVGKGRSPTLRNNSAETRLQSSLYQASCGPVTWWSSCGPVTCSWQNIMTAYLGLPIGYIPNEIAI